MRLYGGRSLGLWRRLLVKIKKHKGRKGETGKYDGRKAMIDK